MGGEGGISYGGRAEKNVVEMVALTEIGFCEDGSEGRGGEGSEGRGGCEIAGGKGENAKQLGC